MNSLKLALKGLLLMLVTPIVFAGGPGEMPGYQHDPSWPKDLSQFAWGVNPEKGADASTNTSGIGVDRKRGLVYVLVRQKPHVRVYRENGEFVRAWSPEKVGRVHMLHLDPAGNIWIADNFAHTVTLYTPRGDALMTLGTYGQPGMDGEHFNQPTDVSTAHDGQTIFVTDGYNNKRVAKFDRTGKYLGMWGGKDAGTGKGEFVLPHSLTVMGDKVYVADREGGRIQLFDLDGNAIGDWRDIFIPWALANANGYLFAVGQKFPRNLNTTELTRHTMKGVYTDPPFPPSRQDVVVFNKDGDIVNAISLPQGHKFGQVDWVHAIDVGAEGDIYMVDVMGNHVQKWKKIRKFRK